MKKKNQIIFNKDIYFSQLIDIFFFQVVVWRNKFNNKMAVLNPNNWHWVDKNTLPWTKQYLNDNFINWSINHNDKIITILDIDTITGDSNVSQRKGKPICYFDLNLKFNIQITENKAVEEKNENESNENDEVNDLVKKGSIIIPEFMHDEDDFIINVTELDYDLKKLVVENFIPEFRSKLCNYQNDLINVHSKDLQN